MKIILDTNFLLIPGTLGVDIFSMIRDMDPKAGFYVVDKTVDELDSIIAKKAPKFKKAAKLAKQFINKFNITILSSKTQTFKNVDELILKIAGEGGYLVATQDALMKKKARSKGLQIIYLRQKKYVIID
ncbi:hypothetical protein KY335_05125 [Candidatus Woesearchaeota archaeon]|nr:hypothetical protein [Candidatus Woesearchaeota archaeon]MBW3014592.1 hypothetical protein [Candidatus Woesearchaeota archaeon]